MTSLFTNDALSTLAGRTVDADTYNIYHDAVAGLVSGQIGRSVTALLSIPGDIKALALFAANRLLTNPSGTVSESMGAKSVVYAAKTGSQIFTTEDLAVLNKYRANGGMFAITITNVPPLVTP